MVPLASILVSCDPRCCTLLHSATALPSGAFCVLTRICDNRHDLLLRCHVRGNQC